MSLAQPIQGKDVAVRVQILPHNALQNKNAPPLKAFRLRMKDNATFADLARTAITRFSKEGTQTGDGIEVDSVLDEKHCALELDETLDLIEPGEVLKLILSAKSQVASSQRADPPGVTQKATQPTRTPAVKGLRSGRLTPFVPKSSLLRSTHPTSLSEPARPEPPKPISTPGRVASAAEAGKGRPKQRDPYEIPSDSEEYMPTRDMTSRRAPLLQAKATTTPNKPKTTSPTRPPPSVRKTAIIPRNAAIITIEDTSSGSSSSSPDSSETFRGAKDVVQEAKCSAPSSQDSKSHGKRSTPHTVNSHLEIVNAVEAPKHKPESRGAHSAYLVKNSQGSIPVSRRNETPASSGNSIVAPPTSSSTGSTKSQSVSGSLTIAPSQLAQRTREFQRQLERQKAERDEAAKRSEEKHAELREANRKKKAQAIANRPENAIAELKKITKTRPSRKDESMQPSVSSFDDVSDRSDEELPGMRQSPPTRTESGSGTRAPPSSVATQRARSVSRAVTPTTKFTPINTLRTPRNPLPQSQAPQKFGAAYSRRVHEAFSDPDDSQTSDSGDEDPENAGDVNDPSRSVSTDAVGTPARFFDWTNAYETTYFTGSGYCSVADGPWMGLIRGGPDSGKFMPGFEPPTEAQIKEMEKVAVRRDDIVDLSDSDSDDSGSQAAYVQESPAVNTLSMKTPSLPDSDSTDVLIMNQLTQEPPSNQELALLMSSSPSRNSRQAMTSSPSRTPSRVAPDDESQSDSESDSDASADSHSSFRPTRRTRTVTPTRSYELRNKDADLDVTPSFERALSQVETPGSSTISTQLSSTNEETDGYGIQSARTNSIVVKIPEMSVDEQAEYRRVPKAVEEVNPEAAIRSFKDINKDNLDTGPASEDSGTAALTHVLEASPMWLNNVTEVADPAAAPGSQRSPYALRRLINSPSTRLGAESGRKRKRVSIAEHQETAYQPSKSDVASDSSVSSGDVSDRPRKKAKRYGTAAPRTEPRSDDSKREHAVALTQSRPERAPATPQKKKGPEISTPKLVSCTPIPAPKVADLMQRLRDTSAKPAVSQQPARVDVSEGVATSPSKTEAKEQHTKAERKEMKRANKDKKKKKKKKRIKVETIVEERERGEEKKSRDRRRQKKEKRRQRRQTHGNKASFAAPCETSHPPQPKIRRDKTMTLSKQAKRLSAKAKPSGYGTSPTLPPLPPEHMRDLLGKKAKRNGFPSPATTSRPSSAGS